MERNLDDEHTQEQPYTRTNLPATEEGALRRIDTLTLSCVQIETQLEQADRLTFVSDDDYADWRNSATAALGHKRVELKFVKAWVESRKEQQKSEAKKAQTHGKQNNLSRVVQQMRARAQTLADEIGPQYTPRYSPQQLPPDAAAAMGRMSELTAVKQKLQDAFSAATEEVATHPIRRESLYGVKRPLQKILTEVETEIGVVRGYLRAHPSRGGGSDWRLVCVQALSRAISEGFKLTAEEKIVFEAMQAKTL